MINNKQRNITEQVKTILTNYPKTRESDEALYMRYLLVYYDIDPHKISFFSVLQKQWINSIPKQESISRARRKCQELYTELRGKNYQAKQEEQKVYIDVARDGSV